MKEEEYLKYCNFINKVLYELLTIDDYEVVLASLGIYKVGNRNGEYISFKSGCHNIDTDSCKANLKLYIESKYFYCFSECCCSYSLLSLVEKRFKLIGQQKSNVACMKYICEQVGIPFDFNVKQIESKNTSQWKHILSKYKSKIQDDNIKSYDNSILNRFDKCHHTDWIDYGISEDTMDKYEIMWYNYRNEIVIPCRSPDGRLIGIRGRNMNPNLNWKYMPITVLDGTEYKFPTGEYFYGANFNSEAIKRNKICWIVESEKSVLKADTWFGSNNVTLGLYGSALTQRKLNYLISLNIDKVVIMLDSDYHNVGDEEYYAFEDKVMKMYDMLKPYFKVYVCYNNQGYDGYKYSPFDFTREQFNILYKEKELISE